MRREQFKKDIKENQNLYNEYNIPKRSTINSAGYDFESIGDYIIKPGERIKIPTGIKASMNPNEVLFLIVRSSMGFKYNVRLCNQVGVIDRDYYNNIDNEGHIFVALQNEGDKDFIIHKKDKFCQGIFISYLVTDNEEQVKATRMGGIGSTCEKGEMI